MATVLKKSAATKAVAAAEIDYAASSRADLIAAAYKVGAEHIRETCGKSDFILLCAAEDAATLVKDVEGALRRFERNAD